MTKLIITNIIPIDSFQFIKGLFFFSPDYFLKAWNRLP